MTDIKKVRPIFCTICNIHNEHLTKDMGLISYCMCKYQGYDSFIATRINGEYPNLKYTPGLRIEEIPVKSGLFGLDTLLWLKKNAKRIDVLNIYHTHSVTLRLTMFYKMLNPKGKVYVKLDGWPIEYVRKLLKHHIILSKNPITRIRNFVRYRVLFRLCDFVSAEFPLTTEALSKDFPYINIGCVPNPINPEEISDYRPFTERSNVIVFVGRIEEAKGSPELLEAFARIATEIPCWKLKFVGAVQDKKMLDDFFAKYPDLKERVILTGVISDRETLRETYRDAKIFAFPSRYESFGIVLTEAMAQGCFAVTSDIPSSRMLTEDFRFALGSPVEDVDALAKNLLYACKHEAEIEALAKEGRNATMRRCDPERISQVIADGLKS